MLGANKTNIVSDVLHRLNIQCLQIFYVTQSRTTTVIHSYLKTSVFISYLLLSFFFFIQSMPYSIL
jgi:hypothetical protein